MKANTLKYRASANPAIALAAMLALVALPGCRACSKLTTKNDTTADAQQDQQGAWTKTALTGANIVSTIAVDPKAPKTIFIGISAGSTDKGFFRTKDGGRSWTKLAGGLPDRYAGIIAISARDGTVLANPGVEGLWRSVDGGETFTHAANDPGGTNGIAFHPTTSTAWMVTSQQGCFRSSDGGKSWARTPNTGLPLNRFSLGPLASDGARLYLGTGGKGIYVSTDDGTAWTKAASLGIPDTAAGGDVLNLVTSQPNVLFVQTARAGIFRSNDGAATFTKLEGGTRRAALVLDPKSPQTIYVGADEAQGPGGIFKSVNGGQSWAPLGPAGVPVESAIVAPDGTVYVGTIGQGVWRLGRSVND